MSIDDILQEIAEHLRGLDFMAGIPVIVEEKGDPDSETEMMIAQQTLCVVVGEREFGTKVQEPNPRSPSCVIGEAQITVSVFEKPVINRADATAPRVKGLARAIGRALAWCRAPGMAAPLWLRRISPVEIFRVEGQDDAIVTRDVELYTTAEL